MRLKCKRFLILMWDGWQCFEFYLILFFFLCVSVVFYLLRTNRDYLDRLVLRPFLPPLDVCAVFFACCVRRIIHRSNCSNSTSFIMWRSRKSGLSNKYSVTCSGDKSEKYPYGKRSIKSIRSFRTRTKLGRTKLGRTKLSKHFVFVCFLYLANGLFSSVDT